GPIRAKTTSVRRHDKRRQVLIQTSQAIRYPSAEVRKARQYEAGVLHERGRTMNIRLRHHRMDERHVIDAGRQVWHQVTHPFAALAILLPAPRTFQTGAGITLKQLDLFAGVKWLPMALDQLRFIVIHVALAGCARHKE